MAEFSRKKCEEYLTRLHTIQTALLNDASAKTEPPPSVVIWHCNTILALFEESKKDQDEFAQAIWAYRTIFEKARRDLSGDRNRRTQALLTMQETLKNFIAHAQRWLENQPAENKVSTSSQVSDFTTELINSIFGNQASQPSATPVKPQPIQATEPPAAPPESSGEVEQLRSENAKQQNTITVLKQQISAAQIKSAETKSLLENSAKEIKRVTNERNTLQARCDESQKTIQRLEQQVQQLQQTAKEKPRLPEIQTLPPQPVAVVRAPQPPTEFVTEQEQDLLSLLRDELSNSVKETVLVETTPADVPQKPEPRLSLDAEADWKPVTDTRSNLDAEEDELLRYLSQSS